ncbi:MAG TPA: hypothetical protein VM537_21825, partial [Anaerolineae bacterium]|nr:hypothetical protein [Anaerolineae bacterium]
MSTVSTSRFRRWVPFLLTFALIFGSVPVAAASPAAGAQESSLRQAAATIQALAAAALAPLGESLRGLFNGGPTATTGAATGAGSTTATLNGTVNANGASTVVTFEYGTDEGYGSTWPAD